MIRFLSLLCLIALASLPAVAFYAIHKDARQIEKTQQWNKAPDANNTEYIKAGYKSTVINQAARNDS